MVGKERKWQWSQESADARARKAEAKLVEIRGSFRQEQLTQMAKIHRLEEEARNARLEPQMAKNNSKALATDSAPIEQLQPFL